MKEITLEMSDGVKVYTSIVEPKTAPIGHIHFLHGMAEHSKRYELAANFFAKQGYIVSAHDHRGHGETARLNGTQGYFAEHNGFHRVVVDAYEVITYIREKYPTNRFILFGHSMGSFIARRYIQVYGKDVDATILSGTGDDGGIARLGGIGIGHLFGKQQGYKKKNHLLDKLVFGRFNKTVDQPLTKFDWLSTNRQIVQSYINDEQCGFVPTTQFFLDLFEGLGIIHDSHEIKNIPKQMPILLFAGTEDPVGKKGKALWKVARQYNKAGIDDVTVMLFDGGRHELIGDATRQEVIQSVLSWLRKYEH